MERSTRSPLAALLVLTLILPSLPVGVAALAGPAPTPEAAADAAPALPEAPPAWDPTPRAQASEPTRADASGEAAPASAPREGVSAAAFCDVPGPDAYGYSCASTTYAWLDTTGGTTLSMNDDAHEYVNLPFAFPWYGSTVAWAYLGSNGMICLQSSPCTEYLASALPNPGSPNPVVACFWEDLNPGIAGTIRYKTVGSAPSRTFVLEFNGVPHHNAGLTNTFPNTFQTHLLESGEVRCMLQNVKNDADGLSTSSGIEGWWGSDGVRYRFGEFAATSTGVRFGVLPEGAVLSQVTSKTTGTGCTQPASNVEFDIRDPTLVHWMSYRVDATPMDIRRVIVNEDTGATWVDDVRTHTSGTGTWCASWEQPVHGTFFQGNPGRYRFELYFSDTNGGWAKQGSSIVFNVWPKLLSGGTYRTSISDGATTFYTNEQFVNVFTRWNTLSARAAGHTIKYHWYRDGWTEHHVSAQQTLSSGATLATRTASLDIQATGAYLYPGTWTVRPWIDGDTNYFLQGQYTFTIAEAPPEPPSAPQGLAVTVPTYAKLRLDWSAPASTGGRPIASYLIYGGDSAGSLSYLGSVPASQLWYEDTGLLPGLRYYQVSAVNTANLEGARSSTASGRAYAEYVVELKAWIPHLSVVDPVPKYASYEYWPTRGADTWGGEPYCHTIWNWPNHPSNADGWYEGDGHLDFSGSFRVRTLLQFRWNGADLYDAHEPVGPRYGETVQYRWYTDTVDSETCVLSRETATTATGAQALDATTFSLDYESENPISSDTPIGAFMTPTIDGALTGAFLAGGDLELRYTTDQFPSHGLRVTRNGASQLTILSTDASCVDGTDDDALKSALESEQTERVTVLRQTDAPTTLSYPSEAC